MESKLHVCSEKKKSTYEKNKSEDGKFLLDMKTKMVWSFPVGLMWRWNFCIWSTRLSFVCVDHLGRAYIHFWPNWILSNNIFPSLLQCSSLHLHASHSCHPHILAGTLPNVHDGPQLNIFVCLVVYDPTDLWVPTKFHFRVHVRTIFVLYLFPVVSPPYSICSTEHNVQMGYTTDIFLK